MNMEAVILHIVLGVLLGVRTEANMCTDADFQADNYDGGIILEMVRYGHYVELKCCTHDVTEVTWSKWNNSTDTWMMLDPDVDDVVFHHHRQIMAINSVDFDDNGLYKCSIGQQSSDSWNLVDRKFKLDIISCDRLARGPFPISPLPCSETITQVDFILTLPCSGYFGCGGKKDIRVVTWLVSPLDKESAWEPVANVDERYVTKDFNREGYSIHGSNLTIHRVSSVDFQRKFMCVLATPQMVNGQSNIVVKLIQDDGVSLDTAAISPLVFVIVVTVASVLLLISLVIASVAIYKSISDKRKQVRKSSEINLISTKSKTVNSGEFSV